jgi:hypothetical protein
MPRSRLERFCDRALVVAVVLFALLLLGLKFAPAAIEQWREHERAAAGRERAAAEDASRAAVRRLAEERAAAEAAEKPRVALEKALRRTLKTEDVKTVRLSFDVNSGNAELELEFTPRFAVVLNSAELLCDIFREALGQQLDWKSMRVTTFRYHTEEKGDVYGNFSKETTRKPQFYGTWERSELSKINWAGFYHGNIWALGHSEWFTPDYYWWFK